MTGHSVKVFARFEGRIDTEPSGELRWKGFSKPVGVHAVVAIREAGA